MSLTSVFSFLVATLYIFAIRRCDGSIGSDVSILPKDTTTATAIIDERQEPIQYSTAPTNTRRQLAVGDFDKLNTLIKDVTLQLQDQTISTGQLDLTVTNLKCQNIRIGDIFLDYAENGGTTLQLAISAFPFSMDCSADYSFGFLLLSGDGSFVSNTQDNAVNATIDLIAPNGFQNETPSTSNVVLCSSTINVVNTEVSGGLVSTVLNYFEDAVSGIISQQANAAVCTIVDELGVTFFNDVLNATSATFDTWLQPIPSEYSDPLYAEQNYVPPEGVTLLSLASSSSSTNVSFSTTGSIGEFVVSAITNADSLLDNIVDDPNSPTGQTLEINVFLRDNFLDENGTYTINFDNFEVDNSGEFNPVLYDGHDKLSKTSIRINAVRVTGLDTMQTFNPLIELGQYTFRNELSWDRLSVQLDLTLDVESSQLTDPILVSDVPIRSVENITISLDLEQINVNASLFIAIDQNKFDSLPLGALLKDPVVCFLSALDTMEVSGLQVSLGQFSEPVIEGFDSPGVKRLLDTLIEAGFIAYEPTLIRAVPYFFQVSVRDIIKNDILEQFLGDNNECLSNAQEIPESSGIDFRDLILPTDEALALGGSGSAQYGNLMPVIFNIVKDEYLIADPTTGLATINTKFITDFGLDQSGTPGRLFFPGNFLNQTREVRTNGKKSTIRLRLFDIYINNIDSFGVPLTILEPVQNEPFLLNNEVSVGVDRPLRFGFRFFIGISNADNEIANDVAVFLDFASLQAMFTLFAKVSEKAFMIFPLHDIFNLQCWLATIPAPELDELGFRVDDDALSLAITEFIASVSDLAFNISCVKCTGTRVPELSELLSGLKDSEDVTAFANGVFNYLKDLISGDFIQVAADRVVNDAKYQCPHSSLYNANYVRKDYGEALAASEDEGAISFFLGLVIVLGFLVISTFTILLITRFIVRRRHAKWVKTLPPSHVRTLNVQQALQKKTNQSLDASTVSMFRSASIPMFMRLSIPIIILGNIGLFLSGHISLAANVSVSASLAGQNFSEEDLFEFSVANSTIELWRAGGRGLAMIIFLLSFAWPYSKQLIVLGLWFASPATVSVSTRGSTLLWLDLLGKWSIVDIFVLVMVLVGFRISIQSPDLEFLPDDFYSIDLLIAPRWGLYANMMAQILSQISSHWIIHYHRRVVFTAAPHLDPTRHADLSDEMEEAQPRLSESSVRARSTDRLFEHAFTRPHRGESDKLIPRPAINPFLYLLAILSCAFVIVGCIVPTFSLNKLGIIGLLVEAGQSFDAAYNEFSVFSTVRTMIEQASVMGNISDYIGLSSLSALIILSVLIVPILQALVLLVQWFAPLTKRRRFRLMVTLEALQAWQYMEVYLLAVLIASWQLGAISSKLINPYCSALENFFTELSYYGILKVEDAQCYRSDIGLEPTFYILLVAAVVLASITSFVSKAVTHYMRDMDPQQNPFHSSGATNDVESASDLSDEKKLDDPSTIQPTPVLFTDRYRWLLHRETAFKLHEHDEIPPISTTKSQGTIIQQNTSSTVSTPVSLTAGESDRRYIDTVADSDDSDIFVDESPVSLVSPNVVGSRNTSQQLRVTEPPIGHILGTGVAVAVVRRGYDVDEDEWIVESVAKDVNSSEESAFLIEGASTNGEGTNPDVNERETIHTIDEENSENNGDVDDGKADASADRSGNDGSCYTDIGVVPDSIADIEDRNLTLNNEATHMHINDQTTISAHETSVNESSPSSVHRIETSQLSSDSQTLMMESKGSDVSHIDESQGNYTSQNGNVNASPETKDATSIAPEEKSDNDIQQISSYDREVVLDEMPTSPEMQANAVTSVAPTSPEMKTIDSIVPDEHSYDDIQQIPSSDSYIVFDDVPASPDIQTTAFITAAPSPSSVQSVEENVSLTDVMPDPCTASVAPAIDVAVTQVVPSECEDKSVANDATVVCDVDGDIDNTCVPDFTQPDDHSVGSDQTPRRILQMN